MLFASISILWWSIFLRCGGVDMLFTSMQSTIPLSSLSPPFLFSFLGFMVLLSTTSPSSPSSPRNSSSPLSYFPLLFVILLLLVLVFLFPSTPPSPSSYASGGSAALCAEMKDQDKRDECYYLFALRTGVQVCDANYIKNRDIRDICFRDLALATGIGDYCHNVDVKPREAECFSTFAKKVGNDVWCDRIEDSLLREACRQDIREKKAPPS